jgi:hypothetical protein
MLSRMQFGKSTNAEVFGRRFPGKRSKPGQLGGLSYILVFGLETKKQASINRGLFFCFARSVV